MRKHNEIYQSDAERYDALVMREDYQQHILPAINQICPLDGRDVVESGAGTGRLTLMLASRVHSIRAYDTSRHMLKIAQMKAEQQGISNVEFGTADHRSLPAADQSADLVLSGWSVCYLMDQEPVHWQEEVTRALDEMSRILKPGGILMLLETLGTGFEIPTPPEHMVKYLAFLEENGFHRNWIRTDYQFESVAEAVELTEFFFGSEVSGRFKEGNPLTLPECTGLWWRQKLS